MESFKKEIEPERIKEAAIKKDGKVYTGRRHADIIAQAENFGLAWNAFAGSRQGFITNQGKFVDREEAARIALKSGQIKTEKEVLFSEDLY